MDVIGRILLVEDDPKDVELTLVALDEYNLAKEVVVATDGEEALELSVLPWQIHATRPCEPGGPSSRSKTAEDRRTRDSATDQE